MNEISEPVIIEPERYEFFEHTPAWETTRRDFFKIVGGGVIVALLVKDLRANHLVAEVEGAEPLRRKSGPGVNVVLVVVGPHQPELVSLATSAGAKTLRLGAPTADMRETVQAGLCWLNEQYHSRDDACWLLAPGDCLAFTAVTVRGLFDIDALDPMAPIVIPTFNAKRGHPTLFTWRHAAGILQIPIGSGIDSYVRSQLHCEVAVDDSGVLLDLDTPADYEGYQNSLRMVAARSS